MHLSLPIYVDTASACNDVMAVVSRCSSGCPLATCWSRFAADSCTVVGRCSGPCSETSGCTSSSCCMFWNVNHNNCCCWFAAFSFANCWQFEQYTVWVLIAAAASTRRLHSPCVFQCISFRLQHHKFLYFVDLVAVVAHDCGERHFANLCQLIWTQSNDGTFVVA